MDELKRIEQLEQKLVLLTEELVEIKNLMKLKADAESAKEVAESLLVEKAETKAAKPLPVETTKKAATEALAATVAETAYVSRSVQKDHEQTTANEKNKGADQIETAFGGKLMGVIAACLVLIGLVVFGSMVYERLNDTSRAIALFLLSAVILGLGIVAHKRWHNWFSLSLIGCGFAAFYVAIFITGMWYNLVSEEVMYGLITVWLFFIGFFVFKNRSTTVAILGECGIIFCTFSGALFLENEGKFYLLFLYFFFISLLYLWIVVYRFLPEREELHFHWLYFTIVVLNELALLMLISKANWLLRENGYDTTLIAMSILGILYMGLSLVSLLFFQRRRAELSILQVSHPTGRKVSKETAYVYDNAWVTYFYFTTIQLINIFVMIQLTDALFGGNDELSSLVSAMLLSIIWMLVEIFGVTGKEGKGIGIVTFFSMLGMLPNMSPYAKCAFLMMTSLILIVSYFMREYAIRRESGAGSEPVGIYVVREQNGRLVPRVISVLLLFPMLYAICDIAKVSATNFVFWSVIALTMFAVHCILLHCGRGEGLGLLSGQKYPQFFLSVLFLGLFIYSYRIPWRFCRTILELPDFPARVITLLFPVALNAYVLYNRAHGTLRNEKRTWVVYQLAKYLNVVLLIFGMFFLHLRSALEEPLALGLLVPVTLYLCGSGLYRVYKSSEHRVFNGLYIGAKVTIYLVALITVIEDLPNFAVSVLLLLIAFASVFLGFRGKLIALRIYGLSLSMIAVLKLMLFDIGYENPMQTVVCLMIAGAICFCISLVYSKVQKSTRSQ